MRTLIPAQHQTVWEWPAVANFTLGGIGAGFYLWGILLALLRGGAPGGVLLTIVFSLGGPALVGLGLLALTTEAGRPMRGYNLFRHWRRSWMSREAIAAAVFMPTATLGWLVPHPALFAVAALAAIAFIVSQGFIVYRARGVTAWHAPAMPPLFVTSALTSGFGVLLLVAALAGIALGQGVIALGILSALANLVVWGVYLRKPDGDFQRATERLRSQQYWLTVGGLGHGLPMLLLLGALVAGGGWAPLLAGLAGLGLIGGVARQKWGIILEAGYLRAIRLPIGTHRHSSLHTV